VELYSTPQYVFMVWCLVKQRDNFTFTYKLIVTQLVKKYPAFLWKPKVYHRAHTKKGPRRFETFRKNKKFLR
jgi:hypothetical protein